MLESIRKRQRTLLMLVTIVVIVAFGWIYNPASMRRAEGPGGAIGKLNGRTITIGDIQKVERSIQLIFSLGMNDLLEQLTTDGRTRDDQFLSFAWNLLLLRDEAKRLQVEPTAEQIRVAEKSLPRFQTNSQFDPTKYQQFVDAVLKPNGFSAADLDDIVADNLRLAGVSQLVKGSSPLPEAMFRQQYEQTNQRVSLAIIRFKRADFESSIQLSDDEIRKYYDQHKDMFQSPEKRKVELVSFLLNDEQKKLPEAQQVTAKKPLAEQADSFAQAVMQNPATFDQAAQEKGLQVQQTELFTQQQPDKAIAQEPALLREAFNLTIENPMSDVIEGKDGFYVMKLTKIEASQPLSLEEAKDKVVAVIKAEKVRNAIEAKAKEVREKIDAEMHSGADFVQAAEKAGYKPETPPAFAPADPGSNIEIVTIMAINSVDLAQGGTSKLLENADGGLIIHMLKKEPIDEQKYEEYKKAEYAQQNNRYETVAIREWLKLEQQRAGRPPIFGQGATG
ncbi:MAG TPA: peptidyl-prolyl cis-trans isomerase [Chthoniobacterales bacterium]|nr:peptidyl-prolyl cis-trans isomerase [Chthoniobacterales bacterium]